MLHVIFCLFQQMQTSQNLPTVIEVSPIYSPQPLPPLRQLSPHSPDLIGEPLREVTQFSVPSPEENAILHNSPNFQQAHFPCYNAPYKPLVSVTPSMKENTSPPGDSGQHNRPGFHCGLPQVLPNTSVQAVTKKPAVGQKRPCQTTPDVHGIPASKAVRDLSFSSSTSSPNTSSIQVRPSKPAALKPTGLRKIIIRPVRQLASTNKGGLVNPPSNQPPQSNTPGIVSLSNGKHLKVTRLGDENTIAVSVKVSALLQYIQ